MSKEWQKQMQKIMNQKGSIKLETSGEEAKLYIYGIIGSWIDDNEDRDIERKLRRINADKIHVHINSPGGSAFDGIAIMNMLKNHSAEIIVHVDGYAASAASVIAMAGDKIIMPKNTMMMIHRASTIAIGTATDFEKLASDLKKIDSALSESYKDRFIGEDEELYELLDEETWLTAQEAKDLGLADVVGEEVDIVSSSEETEEEYDNFKEKLIAKYQPQSNSERSEPTVTAKSKQNMSELFLNL